MLPDPLFAVRFRTCTANFEVSRLMLIDSEFALDTPIPRHSNQGR